MKSAALMLASVLLALDLALSHPASWRPNRRPAEILRRLYRETEWPMVQFEPECSRYDPELTYTLRPGGCEIRDREFTVHYDVNRLGLRDDETSLDAPAIIVLGDSYAMGWGVGEREAFPGRLEAALGVAVLNAGISSYGTARELLLLERLDLHAARAIVLQYCWNDNEENRSYLDHGGRLTPMTADDYERSRNGYLRNLRYYPGKYLLMLLPMAWPSAPAAARPLSDVDDAARDFLDVLAHHLPAFAGKIVVVVSACENTRTFTRSVKVRLATPEQQSLAPLVSLVDPSSFLQPRRLYPLDGHLNPAGHALYARLLEDELLRRGLFNGHRER